MRQSNRYVTPQIWFSIQNGGRWSSRRKVWTSNFSQFVNKNYENLPKNIIYNIAKI